MPYGDFGESFKSEFGKHVIISLRMPRMMVVCWESGSEISCFELCAMQVPKKSPLILHTHLNAH